MKKDATSLSLPTDLVEDIVKQRLHSEISQSLGGRDEFIEGIVDALIKINVNKYNGEKSIHKRCNTVPYLEYTAKKIIEKEIGTFLESWFKENSEHIKKAIRRKLKSQAMHNKIASSLIETFINYSEDKFKNLFKITFSSSENELL